MVYKEFSKWDFGVFPPKDREVVHTKITHFTRKNKDIHMNNLLLLTIYKIYKTFSMVPYSRQGRKMQLDVGNEPYLSKQRCLDHLLTWFFLECSQWQAQTYGLQLSISITFRDMNYYPVKDGQTDRQTDWQTDRKRCIWAHRAICTGGLKKLEEAVGLFLDKCSPVILFILLSVLYTNYPVVTGPVNILSPVTQIPYHKWLISFN